MLLPCFELEKPEPKVKIGKTDSLASPMASRRSPKLPHIFGPYILSVPNRTHEPVDGLGVVQVGGRK